MGRHRLNTTSAHRHRHRLLKPALALCLALCAMLTGGAGVLAARAGGVTADPPMTQPSALTQPAVTNMALTAGYVRGRNIACHTPSAPARMIPLSELQQPFLLDGSSLNTCALLGLVIPAPSIGAPQVGGKVVLVSLSQQWLWAYQDGALVMATPVTTGQPYLWTPTGTYTIYDHVQQTTFYSPWPQGSPWYYTPEHVNYAMAFRTNGYYIHDAPWRQAFGPGTNVQHTDPDGTTQETGSHGCVNVPTSAGTWLYSWAGLGTTVEIVD